MLSTESDVQEGDAWLSWRNKGIGGSEISIIAGLNPYSSVQLLWERKLGIAGPQPMNDFMLNGKRMESFARDAYEFEHNVYVPAKNVQHPKYSWARVSLDGYNHQANSIVEFKVPSSKKSIKAALNGEVPPMYFCQMQYQMFCSGAIWCDYAAYVNNKLYVKRVYPDLKFQRKLFHLAQWFWKKVETRSEITRYDIKLKVPNLGG